MSIKIKKAKITKGRTLEVTLTEYVLVNEIPTQNEVVKKCDYLAHQDLLDAMEKLIPHMINICELGCEKEEMKITGFTIANGNEGEGVVLIGQKTLSTTKVLNLVAPLTEYYSEEYLYGSEMEAVVEDCINEVNQYLDGKSAIKQTALNFDEGDENAEIIIEVEEPKKRGRKKKSESIKVQELENAV